eukprot:1159553-Pelagomonas_calceolata.AAC.18
MDNVATGTHKRSWSLHGDEMKCSMLWRCEQEMEELLMYPSHHVMMTGARGTGLTRKTACMVHFTLGNGLCKPHDFSRKDMRGKHKLRPFLCGHTRGLHPTCLDVPIEYSNLDSSAAIATDVGCQ